MYVVCVVYLTGRGVDIIRTPLPRKIRHNMYTVCILQGGVCVQENLEGEVQRLASFLGLGALPAAKLAALRRRVSLDAMSDRSVITVRKGVVGDYSTHLTPAHWEKMNRRFQERLGDVPTFEPLLRYMNEGQE
jgi:hypothetical protein